MAETRTRSLQLAALVGLAALSVKPVAEVEAAFDLLLSPARVLAELGRPIVAAATRDVHAAEEELRGREAAELENRVALFRDQVRFALPPRGDLRRGRTFVPAEVVQRDRDHLDRIEVELASELGIEVGMPVVCGEAYVGRIESFDPRRPRRAVVALVTGADFAVGAEVEVENGSPVPLVVGGTAVGDAGRAGSFLLAASNPERAAPIGGRLTVRERWPELEAHGELARGFQLGVLERGDRGDLGARPLLDYGTGLFQLAVVAPDTVPEPPERDALELFADGRWRAVRTLSVGDPSCGREGFKLGAGRWNDVRPGAALAFGPRLLGRVARAGTLTSDAVLLGDRGFTVPAVARIAGRARPHVLGRLVSLGRDAATREVLFSWEAIVPAPGADPEPAQLFTGAGEPGLPHGLIVGETVLPPGPGPHVLVVEEPVDARRLGALWVRLLGPDDAAGPRP